MTQRSFGLLFSIENGAGSGRRCRRLVSVVALAVVLGLVGGGSLGAQLDGDFGGTLSLDAQTGTEDDLGLQALLSLWGRGRASLGAESSLTFTAEGGVGVDQELEATPDLDILALQFLVPGAFGARSVLEAEAGRIQVREPSGLVFNHRADGATVDVSLPGVSVRVGGAFTGLLLQDGSSVVMSSADIAALDDEDELWGAPRLVALSDITLPDLAGGQSVLLGGLFQLDMRDNDDTERVDTRYGYLGIDGPIVGSLYWDGRVALSWEERTVDQDTDSGIGLAASAELELFLEQVLNSALTVDGYFGSGDVDPFVGFTPVNPRSTGLLTVQRPEDLVFGRVNYRFRPFSPLSQESVFAQNTELGVYGAGIFGSDFAADEPFQGIELGARTGLRLTSDFGAAARIGVRTRPEQDTQVRGQVQGTLSF